MPHTVPRLSLVRSVGPGDARGSPRGRGSGHTNKDDTRLLPPGFHRHANYVLLRPSVEIQCGDFTLLHTPRKPMLGSRSDQWLGELRATKKCRWGQAGRASRCEGFLRTSSREPGTEAAQAPCAGPAVWPWETAAPGSTCPGSDCIAPGCLAGLSLPGTQSRNSWFHPPSPRGWARPAAPADRGL